MKYSQSGAISALLLGRSRAEPLINTHSNIPIGAGKVIDVRISEVEALQHWQKLKVHGMSLVEYFSEGKIEILFQEMESFTGI